MLSARARWALAAGLSISASLALAYPARELDALRFDCDHVSDAGASAPVIAFVVVALGAACMLAWSAIARGALDRSNAFAALAWTVPANAIAAAWPSFLSKDVLYYAALGRALARYGGDPYAHISQSLPRSDPFWLALPIAWRHGTSAYFPGFHAICRVIATAAGDDVRLAVHLHQALALACMLTAAWLAGETAATWLGKDPEAVRAFTHFLGADAGAAPSLLARRARAVAIVLVGFSPLTILEASSSAHNDAYLALGLAAGMLLHARGRAVAACAVVLLVMLVKPTGIVIAGSFVCAIALAHVRSRWKPSRRVARAVSWMISFAALAGALAALPWLRRMTESLDVGRPPMTSAGSLEAIPRALLFAAGDESAEKTLVFVIRAAGVAWLARVASGAIEDGRALARISIAVFGFYIFFAGWSQPWYLLPLLAMVPFADARWLRAITVETWIFPLTYVVIFSFPCGYPAGWATWTTAAVAQCILVVGVPLSLRRLDRSSLETTP